MYEVALRTSRLGEGAFTVTLAIGVVACGELDFYDKVQIHLGLCKWRTVRS